MAAVAESDDDGKMLSNLLKKAGIFNDADGNPQWRIKVKTAPEGVDFEDAQTIDFMGYAFVNKLNNKVYLNPPKELIDHLAKEKLRIVKNQEKIEERERVYGPNVNYGYYKVGTVKKASIEKLQEEIEEDDDDIELNYNDMRSWAIRKTASFTVYEAGVQDSMLACIAAKAHINGSINPDELNALADIMASVKRTGDSGVRAGNMKAIEEEEETVESEEIAEKRAKLAKYEKALKSSNNSEERTLKLEKAIKKLKKDLEKL